MRLASISGLGTADAPQVTETRLEASTAILSAAASNACNINGTLIRLVMRSRSITCHT
ncbi:hypothetical protein D3C78_1733070 [compost metagenome]